MIRWLAVSLVGVVALVGVFIGTQACGSSSNEVHVPGPTPANVAQH